MAAGRHAEDVGGIRAQVADAALGELLQLDGELCEIADRVMKQPGGGKALFFENVILDNGERSRYPVVINLFGSMRRMSLALGVDDLDEIGDRITEMLDLKVPEGIIGKLSMLPRRPQLGKFPPRLRTGKPPCQEIVLQGDEVDLSKLPIITCWPEDGGPYITLPMVMPFLMLAILFRAIENFKMFDMVNLLTSGVPGSTTEVASLTLKREAFEKWRTGYSSALAIILFVTVFGAANIYVKVLNRVKQR